MAETTTDAPLMPVIQGGQMVSRSYICLPPGSVLTLSAPLDEYAIIAVPLVELDAHVVAAKKHAARRGPVADTEGSTDG